MKPTTSWDELEANMRKYNEQHPEVASGKKEMSAADSDALDKVIAQVWEAEPLF